MPVGTKPRKNMGDRGRDTTYSSNDSKRNRAKNNRSQADINHIASAKRSYERYTMLARNALSTGDVVEIENFYQHAEHYHRQMNLQTV